MPRRPQPPLLSARWWAASGGRELSAMPVGVWAMVASTLCSPLSATGCSGCGALSALALSPTPGRWWSATGGRLVTRTRQVVVSDCWPRLRRVVKVLTFVADNRYSLCTAVSLMVVRPPSVADSRLSL